MIALSHTLFARFVQVMEFDFDEARSFALFAIGIAHLAGTDLEEMLMRDFNVAFTVTLGTTLVDDERDEDSNEGREKYKWY